MSNRKVLSPLLICAACSHYREKSFRSGHVIAELAIVNPRFAQDVARQDIKIEMRRDSELARPGKNRLHYSGVIEHRIARVRVAQQIDERNVIGLGARERSHDKVEISRREARPTIRLDHRELIMSIRDAAWQALCVRRGNIPLVRSWLGRACQSQPGLARHQEASFRLTPVMVDTRVFRSNRVRRRACDGTSSVALIFSVTEHLAVPRAPVDPREMFFQTALEQWPVRNVAEIFGDEPESCRSHPMAPIDAGRSPGVNSAKRRRRGG